MSATSASGTRRALVLALALYAVWVFATWFFEGRILTFQRPEDIGARLTYALVANVLVGIGGTALVIRFLSGSGEILSRQAGFRGIAHAVAAVAIGGALGFALYALQGAPSWNPVVLLNAYSQVLVGSIAEVMACWAVVGTVAEAVLRDGRGRWVSVILAAIVASVLFGVYHFAHSPPFNAVGTVAFLSVVGLLTSAFFFVSRDVYGTIAFHNFLGIFGVIGALEASGNLSAFEHPLVPVLVMAVVAVAALIAAHVCLINTGSAPAPPCG
jgi:hypothetical protein